MRRPRLPAWLVAEVRPVLVFTGAGSALCRGSVVLAERAWAWLGDRLTMPERLGALAVGCYAAGYTCWHAPFAAPAAVVAWCAAAWCCAPPPIEPEPPAAADATAAFATWLLQLMGDQSGIHLRDLYPAMRQLPGHADRDNAQLRAALRTLGIPVQRSLRIGTVAGRSGVARADVEPLSSPLGEPRVESDGDAGQSQDSPAGEQPVEPVESA